MQEDKDSILLSKEISEFILRTEGNRFKIAEDNQIILKGWNNINAELHNWTHYSNMVNNISEWEKVYREIVKKILLIGWKKKSYIYKSERSGTLIVKCPYIPCIDWREYFNKPILKVTIIKNDHKSNQRNYINLDYFDINSDIPIDTKDIDMLNISAGDSIEMVLSVDEE